MALKCADIGHLAATPDVHKRWALLLEEEFFLQVPFMPFCPCSVIGVLSFIARLVYPAASLQATIAIAVTSQATCEV